MSDIAPIGRPAATYSTVNGRAHASPTPPATPARGSDSVELSSAAQMLGKLRELPDVRQDLVDRVRAEIASGTYETPDKVDAAVDALLEDVK